ncbi:hypothetical protein PVAND_003187 [Polypedilum vanderplanki]|uniref:Uncharacterized protein n=1 Tax=Polypedilum vanderplanki TaxID=319348 RepID=A0A9J6BT99_POLVA|nr:hypothetical protein PVAND_003187 [Polypedilum vanderplanki]
MASKRLITIALFLVIWFCVLINADEEKVYSIEGLKQNWTIECEINGVKRYDDECLETFKKFSKTVGYIVTGVIVTIILCCCGCVCCACKIIHSNNNQSRDGVVLQQRRVIEIPNMPPNAPVIATVAQ